MHSPLRYSGSPVLGGGGGCYEVDTGVLCATEIPSGIVLGSLQGELRIGDSLTDERKNPYMIQVRYVDGKIVVTDEVRGSELNWMRYISAARNDAEQNTEATTTIDGEVVLRTTRQILIGEEILVWYSDKLQRIMNVLPVLPSRDRSGELRYICQRCCKPFCHPNTLKAHLRFNCSGDLYPSGMFLPHYHPVSRLKNRFDIDLSLQWPSIASHYINPTYSISHLRSFTNSLRQSEDSTRYRAFSSQINKCNSYHKSAFTSKQEHKAFDSKSLKRSWSDLEDNYVVKSTGSPPNDLVNPLHSQLLNCSVPPLNLPMSSLSTNKSPCFLYGCNCYQHQLGAPTNSLPLIRQPYPCQLSDHLNASSTDISRRWSFQTLFPYPIINSSDEDGTSKDRDASSAEPHLILSKTSQSMKSKRGHLCIYCGKFYSRKYGLKIHLRTHTGYKPLKCKVCLRPFGDPSNLNKHIRLHADGETPYRCRFCGKVLVRRRDLQRHIKSRHPNEVSLEEKDDELKSVLDISSSSPMYEKNVDSDENSRTTEHSISNTHIQPGK